MFSKGRVRIKCIECGDFTFIGRDGFEVGFWREVSGIGLLVVLGFVWFFVVW